MSETKFKFSVNCPLPENGYEKITMGHGSGGSMTFKLLESGVFKLFSNEFLDQKHDGALLDLNGKSAFTTDSFVIDPIFFPGGNIGELAVNGTVNDLAMCGALPLYISTAFIIEEGLSVSEFWEILLGIREAAQNAGVKIVTGDTKVVEKGKGDKIFINTTGIGEVHPHSDISMNRIQKDDLILVSGSIANHGMAIMSVREGMEFETDILSDTTSLHKPVMQLINELGKDVKLLRDPTRGGVATVLNEIALSTNLGIVLDEGNIPVHSNTKSACELLGLDPLYVANEGVFIAVIDRSAQSKVIDLLSHFNSCKEAAFIGTFTTSHPQKVVMNSTLGGRRVVNMLPGEQLPRIC